MKLSRQPCPRCQEDTLHSGMQCVICKHVSLTPSEQRRRSVIRHIIKVKLGRAPQVNSKLHTEARRRDCAAQPDHPSNFRLAPGTHKRWRNAMP